MGKIQNIPSWVQLILALAAMLVSVTLAYGAVQTDLALLRQRDTHIESSVDDIRQMLREEFERHHPRQK